MEKELLHAGAAAPQDKRGGERKQYFDVLRIVASFAVVMLHVAAHGWRAADVHSASWNAMNLYNSIVRWGVPVFFMISGALFLKADKPIGKMYSKYILRLVIAYLVWALFYALVKFKPGSSIFSLLKKVYSGHFHMWFIPTLIGLYMITPLLRPIVAKPGGAAYFLILSFIFGILLPQIASTAGLFSATLEGYITNGAGRLRLSFVLGYSFYYVLGYYLNGVVLNNKLRTWAAVLGSLGFIFTVAATLAASRIKGEANDIFYNNMSVNVMLEAVFVFIMLKSAFEHRELGTKTSSAVSNLSKWSFGVYLVHPFIIIVLRKIGFFTTSFPHIISIPVISIIVFAVSMLISAILNKIPIVNKYAV